MGLQYYKKLKVQGIQVIFKKVSRPLTLIIKTSNQGSNVNSFSTKLSKTLGEIPRYSKGFLKNLETVYSAVEEKILDTRFY